MNFEAISGAAAVALAGSAAFALLAAPALLLFRARKACSRFAGLITPEPAQRIRDRIAALDRRQSLVVTAGIVFVAVFLASWLMAPESRFAALAPWQLVALAVITLAAVAAAVAFLLRIRLARRRLRFVRDAGIAVGQGLHKLTGNLNRVFHEVPCGGWVLDNVVVGLHGIYAVYVIARRPGRHNKLRLHGDQLLFAPGKYRVSLSPYLERSELLARQLRKVLKVGLRVRPVIAVPGWEIESQSGDSCLIVNERNLVMLRGWKDGEEYLMHEDVERLQELLTERCIRFGNQPAKAPVSFNPAGAAAPA